jgi:predicted amidohydrolase YtcJ
VIAYRGALAADDADVRRLVDELALPAGAELRGLAGDLCIDGSLGSRTAALRQPYRDADTSGHRYLDVHAVRDHVTACTRARLQAGFHVIGDAALDVALAGFRAAADIVGAPAVRAARHRLEHVEMVDADAVAALGDLAITASVQPAFDAAWGGESGMYAERLGPERAAAMNPLAALTRAGVALVLGSDSPVTPFDPWGAVAAAAQHRTPSSRISARAGFLAATRGGWRAAGADGQGVLAPGARATFAVWSTTDLVVQTPDDRVRAWSTDPRSGTPGLPDLTVGADRPRCLRTVIGGQIAFDCSAWP